MGRTPYHADDKHFIPRPYSLHACRANNDLKNFMKLHFKSKKKIIRDQHFKQNMYINNSHRLLLYFHFQAFLPDLIIILPPNKVHTLFLKLVAAETISFLIWKLYKIQIVAANFSFLPNKLNFCRGKNSREETVQEQKLYKEIQ